MSIIFIIKNITIILVKSFSAILKISSFPILKVFFMLLEKALSEKQTNYLPVYFNIYNKDATLK